MNEPDLSADIDDARGVLAPHVVRLQGLLQMWHMFYSARLVSQEFHNKFEDLSYQLKIACTRSLVVDYLKPWSGNFSSEINSLRVYSTTKQWRYPFLDSIVQTEEHDHLIELRNNTVAHLGPEYEGRGISVKGMRIVNSPTGGKQEGTLDDVFLPAVTVMSGIRGIWWLSNKDKLKDLCGHIENAIKVVEKEISKESALFRADCTEHMHVLSKLPDLFGLIEIPLVAGNFNITTQAEDPRPLTTSSPAMLKIGDQNIQSLVTVYEPRPEYPTGVEIKGKGYILKIGDMSESGQLNYNVIFPKYPYPKEPVE